MLLRWGWFTEFVFNSTEFRVKDIVGDAVVIIEWPLADLNESLPFVMRQTDRTAIVFR